MKNYILLFAMLSIFAACNNDKTSTDEKVVTNADSMPAKIDSPKALVPATNLGVGLTLEEMKDDSVFVDGSVPTSWEMAGIKDVKGFKLFIKQLQLLVLDNNKEGLAKQIRYPLGKAIKTEADFIKNYDNIFTKDVKLSIAKINFSQIFRNSKGAMSDAGMVWFSQEGNEFKIIAVNK
jgi:hypothetical protein